MSEALGGVSRELTGRCGSGSVELQPRTTFGNTRSLRCLYGLFRNCISRHVNKKMPDFQILEILAA